MGRPGSRGERNQFIRTAIERLLLRAGPLTSVDKCSYLEPVTVDMPLSTLPAGHLGAFPTAQAPRWRASRRRKVTVATRFRTARTAFAVSPSNRPSSRCRPAVQSDAPPITARADKEENTWRNQHLAQADRHSTTRRQKVALQAWPLGGDTEDTASHRFRCKITVTCYRIKTLDAMLTQ